MVRFIDVAHMRDWVSTVGVAEIIRGMAGYVEDDFRRWDQFEKAPRVASHSQVGVIELMPTCDGRNYAFKYVNGHPGNPSRGLQTVTAFGVLSDVDSGYPVMWSEMTVLTALRTATISAVAARVLARPESTTMALIGTGSQAEFQSIAFRELLGITSLRIWDTDPGALDKFERNAAGLGFDIYRANSASDAAHGADIITTCTADKALATVLTDDMVAPGVHVNAIGGDCPGKTELDAAILHRASIFIEFEEQTRIEGDIQQLDPAHPVTELHLVLNGEAPGRTSASEITVWDAVGFAIEDFSALRYVNDATKGTRFCTDVDLVADPSDPKDLFALVNAGANSLVGVR